MEVVEGWANVEDLDAFLEELGAIGAERDCAVQAIDARYVAGRDHLEQAVRLANRAFERGNNVARERAMEILLFTAATRQIDVALELGVERGQTPVVVVIDGNGEGAAEAEAARAVESLLDPAETLGKYDEGLVREWFEIGDAELTATDASLEELVCERVALLVVER